MTLTLSSSTPLAECKITRFVSFNFTANVVNLMRLFLATDEGVSQGKQFCMHEGFTLLTAFFFSWYRSTTPTKLFSSEKRLSAMRLSTS